ncbi:MAG: hypothetical protein QM750_04390 [Rubrivivax sp.]
MITGAALPLRSRYSRGDEGSPRASGRSGVGVVSHDSTSRVSIPLGSARSTWPRTGDLSVLVELQCRQPHLAAGHQGQQRAFADPLANARWILAQLPGGLGRRQRRLEDVEEHVERLLPRGFGIGFGPVVRHHADGSENLPLAGAQRACRVEGGLLAKLPGADGPPKKGFEGRVNVVLVAEIVAANAFLGRLVQQGGGSGFGSHYRKFSSGVFVSLPWQVGRLPGCA